MIYVRLVSGSKFDHGVNKTYFILHTAPHNVDLQTFTVAAKQTTLLQCTL